MKTILIIGMGKFGHHLCQNLLKLENEVMIVDKEEEQLEDMVSLVTSAKIGDCTNPEVLATLGINDFDVVFVCIGTNFQSSLEITSLVKEMEAKYVVSKANRDIHAKFLLRNGADEVIYPERDIAEKLAIKYSSDHFLDYIELTEDYSIYEIMPLKEWVGKSIREADIRAKYQLSVIGYKQGEKETFLPKPNHIIKEEETLIVIGHKDDMGKILHHFQ